MQNYLKTSSPKQIIVGKKDCNLLLVGYEKKYETAIRSIFLTVGCSEISDVNSCLDELRNKYKADGIFRNLFEHGRKLAELAKLSFILTAYKSMEPTDKNEKEINSMRFFSKQIYPLDSLPQIYSSDGFAEYIYGLLGVSFKDCGTNKKKNKTLADAFHLWSRNKLSAHIIKQDFDAIYYSRGRYTMIEIKRAPSRSLKDWVPYTDDIRNYAIQFKIAQMMNAPYYTFHHNGNTCYDNTLIGCYRIESVDISDPDGIKYKKKIIRAKDIFDVLEEEDNGQA